MCSVDLLHEIGRHLAAADPLDEALASVVNLAITVVKCDSCFIYVLEQDEFVLWVWKNSDRRAVNQSELQIRSGITDSLTAHHAPIALWQNASDNHQFKAVSQWSQEPGETFVSVPLLPRGKLVGVIICAIASPTFTAWVKSSCFPARLTW